MKSKIISNEKDTVGIIFFGTVREFLFLFFYFLSIFFIFNIILFKESTGTTDIAKNVFNYLPLGPPSAERILSLQVQ